jgi:dTDP-glucose 4,6-dehydratase
MNVVTTNCSNNFGPKQHEEKLIPTIISKALALESIPIYGDGENIRDWLYVLDHCRAIDKIFHEGRSGETYLIGGHNEKTNIEIAETICNVLNEEKPLTANEKGIIDYKELIKFVQDRPGHDFRYAIDDEKLLREIDFTIEWSFEEGVRETVKSFIKNRELDNLIKLEDTP